MSTFRIPRLRLATRRSRLVLAAIAVIPGLLAVSARTAPSAAASIDSPVPQCVTPPGLPTICPPPAPSESPTVPPPTPAPTLSTPPPPPTNVWGAIGCPYQDFACDPTGVDPTQVEPYIQAQIYDWIVALEQWYKSVCSPTC
jgi:hypothetical protein